MIKAIETKYKGYRFRSRLEARWAVIFDELGIEWVYEHEGFNLPNGDFYLPDFYIPSSKSYIEVKGCEPTEDEIVKSAFLSNQIGVPIDLISTGDPALVAEIFSDIMSIRDVDESDYDHNIISYKAILSAIDLVRDNIKSYIFYGGTSGQSLLLINDNKDGIIKIQNNVVFPLFYILSMSKHFGSVLFCCGSDKKEAKTIIKMAFDKINKAISCGNAARFEHGERG